MKRLLKSVLPAGLLDLYHLVLARAAALFYRHPSEEMTVIGVTGTNGKSTVVNMIAAVLEADGHTVGFITTANIRIGDQTYLNDMKMTMPGRFTLQRLLRRMADAGCTHAIVETSSEGIKQHRHVGINYDVAVFTNLTPEHIESHGSFDAYRQAKGRLFAGLTAGRRKVRDGAIQDKISVVNLGDGHAGYFLGFPADRKYGYHMDRTGAGGEGAAIAAGDWPIEEVVAREARLTAAGSEFTVRDTGFSLRLPGAFNVENALAAVAVGTALGTELPVISRALADLESVPGRLETVDEGQPFRVVVDYAPEPESFRRLYDVVSMMEKGRVIHVFGSCGGGRDRARRPILGSIAGRLADIVIITDEDPYDDDPLEIMRQVAAGAVEAGKREGQDLHIVPDRGEAIDRAVALAREGDLVLITGKGAEQAICVAGGRKIPWDDRRRVRRALRERSGQQKT